MLSQRTRHPREIDFRLLRSVGAKNYGFVSSDARKEAGEKILPQGVYGRARPGRRAQPTFRVERGSRRVSAKRRFRRVFTGAPVRQAGATDNCARPVGGRNL